MTNTNDAYARSMALEKALKMYESGSRPPVDVILEAAEKFRAFLSGETAKAEGTDQNPKFKLPSYSDEYVYFQFSGSPILYRSDLGYSSMSGGISRINARIEKGWTEIKSTGQVGTRAKIRNQDAYHEISSADAAKVLKAYVKDVRFE